MTPFTVYTIIYLIYINTNLCYGSESGIVSKSEISVCQGKVCISKCCPLGLHVHRKKKCEKYKFTNVTLDFTELLLYNEKKTEVVSNVNKSMVFIPNKFANETFKSTAKDVSRIADFNLFLTVSGTLYVEIPNAYKRWIKVAKENVCVDYQVPVNKMHLKPRPDIWVVMEQDADVATVYFASAFLISCFFLLLVFIVYALLPELRNLCGMILMAYVFSLFWAFLLFATVQIGPISKLGCVCLTYFIYYFFLATFCWMNVMSYDIWWTFRGYAKARPIHRRGEHFKFLMYCLYAFGLPLAMTIVLIVMNTMDLRSKPWIVIPFVPRHGCFLDGGEKLLYLYMPMMILILSNWIFYLMTAFNVWRLSRGTAVLDTAAAGSPAAHRTHWHRFMVYLKLSVVMGLNWVFEVVSFLSPDFRVWKITDAYNLLIGLAIFLIFVCKKKILRKLIKRYKMGSSNRGRWDPSNRSVSSTASDGTSQETTLPLVCVNPKGPEIEVKI